jgi:hypothetical protein
LGDDDLREKVNFSLHPIFSASNSFPFSPQMKALGASMIKMWSLMGTPVHEQLIFEHGTCNIAADVGIAPNSLSLETLEQVRY